MNFQQIISTFSGVTVTIVTTNPVAAVAVGEVLDGAAFSNVLALKLTAAFDGFPVGATVIFNPAQIVAIG